MDIYKKGLKQISCKFSFSYNSYLGFLREVTKLAHKYEAKSNPHKISYYVTLNGVKKPYMKASGICSRTKGQLHVGFIDTDNIRRYVIEDEALMLIQKYNLPPFYLFSTKEEFDKDKPEKGYYGNYYLINLMVKPLFEWMEIHRQTSSDTAHRIVTSRYSYRNAVLRFSKKGKKDYPKFIEIIGDINKEYNQLTSKAHLNVLKTLYPEIPDIKYNNQDGYEELYYVDYKTGNP